MGVIISGFSNIGKSYLIKNKNINCIDFDTCYFKKINNWINIYVECVLALKEKYDYVLITTYGEILNELNKRNIEYYLVYPKRELKEETGLDVKIIPEFRNSTHFSIKPGTINEAVYYCAKASNDKTIPQKGEVEKIKAYSSLHNKFPPVKPVVFYTF